MADEYRLKFITEWDSNHAKASQEMQSAIHKVSNATKDLQKDADNTSGALKDMLKQTAAFAGISLGAAGLKSFVTQMVNVRKEVQSLNTSFRVLLGNQQAADKMFGELREFAAKTPLALNDLASSAQTMLGFGVAAEKVVPALKAIGDVSMGNGEKLKSLSLAFSQVMATGKLMGQDFLQMVNAGFNPLNEMAIITGKSVSTLKDEMSKGAISAEMVSEAFLHAAGAEGQFHGMLEQMGDDVEGKMNTMKGAISDMFNELGTSSEGAIVKAIGGVTTLVQNYETVGKVIASLVATYGTYRAALIVTNVIESTRLVGLGMTTVAMKEYVLATKAGTVAQAAFNAVANANPYVLLATAIVAVGTAIWAFSKNVDEATEMQSKFNAEREKFNKSIQDEEKETKNLLKIIQDENSTDAERIQAYEQMKLKCHELTDKYKLEELQVLKLADAYKILTGAQTQRTIEDLEQQIDIRQKALDQLQKRQRRSSDVQAFMDANDMTHKDVNEVKKMLQQQIADLKAELDPKKDAQAKADANKKTNYAQAAAAALKDWQDAKKLYEQLKASKESTVEEVKAAETALETADKKYEEITGQKASALSKSSLKHANDAAKDAKKAEDLKRKQLKEEVRMRTQMLRDAEQAEIDTIRDGGEKSVRQLNLNYQKQVDSINDWFEEIKQKKVENARALFDAMNDDPKKTFDEGTVNTSYTEEETDAYKKKLKSAISEYQNGMAQLNAQQYNEMLEYLAQYGSMYEQKLAIAEQIDREIAATDSEWQKKSLAAQKAEIERQAMHDQTMGRLQAVQYAGTSVQNQLKPFLTDLKKTLEGAINSKEFAKLSQVEQNEYLDQNAMLTQMGIFSDSVLSVSQAAKNLETAIKKSDTAQTKLNKALDVQSKKTEELKKANENLAASQLEYEVNQRAIEEARNAGDIEFANQLAENSEALRNNMEADKEKVDSLSDAVNAVNSEVIEFTDEANQAAADEVRAREQVTESLAKGEKSFNDTINAFHKISSASGVFSMIGEKIGGVWGAIIQIIGEIKGDAAGWIEGLLNDIGGIFETLLKQLIDGSLIESIGEGIGSVFNSIGSGLGISGNNENRTEKNLTELKSSADNLRSSIDNLKDEIGDAKGYIEKNEKINAQKNKYVNLEQNLQQQLREYQEKHGSHHSNTYYLNQRFAGQEETYQSLMNAGFDASQFTTVVQTINKALEEFAKLNDTQASTIQSAGDLWNLSAKEWAYIRDNQENTYEFIKSVGKYGDNDSYFDQLADLGDKLLEVEKYYKEQRAGFSFDSMFDEFMNTLYDMDSAVEEFGDNFQKNMEKKLIFNALGDEYSAKIKDVYEQYYAAIDSAPDGILSEKQIEDFAQQLEDLGKEAVAKRDQLLKATGNGIEENYVSAFEEIRSSFLDLCNNLESTAEDFEGAFANIIYNSLIEAKMQEGYDEIIKQWRDDLNKAINEGDGTLSEDQIVQFRESYNKIISDIRADAEQIAAITGKNGSEKIEPLISFDDIKGSFSNLMSNLDAEATAFTDDLKQKMFEALMQKELENGAIGKRLQEWYGDFASWMEAGADTQSETYQQLIDRYNTLTVEAKEGAKVIAESLGIAVDKVEEAFDYISFDSIKSSFTSLIGNMTMEAEDFTESFKKMMFNAIISSHIDNAFKAQLDAIDADLADILNPESDNYQDKTKVAEIQKSYVKAGLEMAEFAKGIADSMGYSVKKVEETVEEVEEEAKKFDFDYVKDKFTSLLSDLSADATKFGEGLNDMLFEAMLDKQFTQKFEGRLQAWYDEFDRFIEGGGTVGSKEYDDLIAKYQQLGSEASSYAQQLADAIGLSTETMLDKLTSTSYDNVRGDFMSMLMDMEKDSADFADDFTTKLQQAMINAQLGELMDDQLKTWYKQFGAVMEDGNLSDAELSDLRAAYDDIVEDALKQRDAIAKITGYDKLKQTSQSGGSSAFTGMTQDLGSELNGRFTAVQESGEQTSANTSIIAAQMADYVTHISSMADVAARQNEAVQEIRNMMVYTNSYLDDIAKYVKLSYGALSQKLGNISNNLKTL